MPFTFRKFSANNFSVTISHSQVSPTRGGSEVKAQLKNWFRHSLYYLCFVHLVGNGNFHSIFISSGCKYEKTVLIKYLRYKTWSSFPKSCFICLFKLIQCKMKLGVLVISIFCVPSVYLRNDSLCANNIKNYHHLSPAVRWLSLINGF